MYGNLVASQNAYVVFAHLAGDVRDNLVSVFEFDSKLGIGQGLNDYALHFYTFFFCHEIFGSSALGKLIEAVLYTDNPPC